MPSKKRMTPHDYLSVIRGPLLISCQLLLDRGNLKYLRPYGASLTYADIVVLSFYGSRFALLDKIHLIFNIQTTVYAVHLYVIY
jgi:hypothetical protein